MENEEVLVDMDRDSDLAAKEVLFDYFGDDLDAHATDDIPVSYVKEMLTKVWKEGYIKATEDSLRLVTGVTPDKSKRERKPLPEPYHEF